MKPDIQNRYRSDLCVLLDEEYGYRKWFWFPSMSAVDLEKWWSQLETIDSYFMTPEPLPGDLYQVEDDDENDLFIELYKSDN